MIIKGNTVGFNDGSGLYDTAGILRSAMQDINALMLQGVVNWNRAASALGKIESAIRAVEARDKEDEEAADAAAKKSAEDSVKVIEFKKDGDVDGGV
jgi:hypothetical protein